MIKKSLVKRVAVIGCLAIGAMTFVACGSAGGAKNLAGVYVNGEKKLTINDNASYTYEFKTKKAVPMSSVYVDETGYGSVELKDGKIYFTDVNSNKSSYGEILDNGDIKVTYDPGSHYTVDNITYSKTALNQ